MVEESRLKGIDSPSSSTTEGSGRDSSSSSTTECSGGDGKSRALACPDPFPASEWGVLQEGKRLIEGCSYINANQLVSNCSYLPRETVSPCKSDRKLAKSPSHLSAGSPV